MDELMELNQMREEPTEEIPMEIICENLEARMMEILNTEGLILEQMKRNARTLNTLATEEDLRIFTEKLAKMLEEKNQSLAQEWEKKREELKQAGKANERSIEQTEQRIKWELESLTKGIANLWMKVWFTIAASLAVSVAASSLIFLGLR